MDDVLTLSRPPNNDMPGVLSFYKLLSQASSLPCSSGAAAFLSLVPSENQRFPLALDVLLPALQDRTVKPPQRILAAYVLHALYASHDHLNPFYHHLLRVFESERAATATRSTTFQLAGSPEVLRSPQEGVAGVRPENEQFVWVLWKILRGEGEDLAPYSPNILSRTALPDHLRTPHLVLHNAQSPGPHPNVNDLYPSKPRHSSFTHSPHLEKEIPYHSQTDSLTGYFPIESHRTQSTSTFSPFETENIRGLSGEQGSLGSGWSREASPNVLHQDQHQTQSELLRRLDTHSKNPQRDIPSMYEAPSPSSIATTKDHRREALLHALCEESSPKNAFPMRGKTETSMYLRNDNATSSDNSDGLFNPEREIRRSGSDMVSGHQLHRDLRGLRIQQPSPQYSPGFPPVPPLRVQPQFVTAQNNELSAPGRRLDGSTSSFATTASSYHTTSRIQPGPIARPTPALPPSSNFPLQEAAPITVSIGGSLNSQYTAGAYSQAARASPVNGSFQQPQRSAQTGFSQKMQKPIASASLSPMRNPGIIGSGRPSSKSTSPVGSDAGERGRRPNVGVIGRGRPPPLSPGDRSDVVNEGTFGMMPYSVERTEQLREGGGKRDFGAIGRPKSNVREGGEWLLGGRDGTEFVPTGEVNDATKAHPPARSTAWKIGSNGEFRESTIPTPSSAAVQHQPFPESSILRANNVSSPSTEDVSGPDTPNSTLSSSQNHLPLPASTSPPLAIQNTHPRQQTENPYMPSILANMDSQLEIDEKARDELSRAIVLLLSARERVLTLSEQRALIPHLPMLTRPLSLLRPGDLLPLIAKNPDVAARLLVFLLDRDDDDGARVEQVLRDLNKIDLFRLESAQGRSDAASCSSISAVDAVQTVVQFVTGTIDLPPDSAGQDKVSPFGGREAREGYLEALRRLPPTMQSFNLIARLLRPTPQSEAATESSNNQDIPEVRIARLVRTDVLGGLISGCVHWIEKAEEGERDGEVLDDRVAVYVSNLSRFYASLLKHGFVSAESEVDTTEIMSFALQFSRFEDARSLYSMLAAARA